jgi:biopolymer transport protein ExbD
VNGPAVDLPKVDATRMNDRPRTVQVALDAQDRIFIDGAEVNKDSLGTRLQETSIKGASSSEMHLRADRRTHYERVAEIMAIAQNVGIVKIAFVTEAAK